MVCSMAVLSLHIMEESIRLIHFIMSIIDIFVMQLLFLSTVNFLSSYSIILLSVLSCIVHAIISCFCNTVVMASSFSASTGSCIDCESE